MIYFEDNRVVNFEDLRKVVDKDGNRVYSERLLQGVKGGDLNYLNEIDLSDRNNKFFMEPLLYAVKNSEYSTYEVYKYYGEELQMQDLTIAAEIARIEPDVIEDTAISDNATIILYLAKINPEVILYISEDLKNDGEFIEELFETGNKEAITYAVRECDISTVIQDNPELASNPVFMKEAIKEDANALKYADENLRNDYKFIKEASKENKEVINYVSEHTEVFGQEALEGAKDSLEEHFTIEATTKVQEERRKLQEEKLSLQGKENNESDLKEITKKERDLTSIERAMEKFKTLSPEKKGRYAHLILQTTSMEQYQNMDENFREELEKYEKLYIAAKEKEKSKSEVAQEQPEKKSDDKVEDTIKITPNQIEEKTADAKVSEINGETQAIREEYIRETNEKEVEKEDGSVGNEERA